MASPSSTSTENLHRRAAVNVSERGKAFFDDAGLIKQCSRGENIEVCAMQESFSCSGHSWGATESRVEKPCQCESVGKRALRAPASSGQGIHTVRSPLAATSIGNLSGTLLASPSTRGLILVVSSECDQCGKACDREGGSGDLLPACHLDRLQKSTAGTRRAPRGSVVQVADSLY